MIVGGEISVHGLIGYEMVIAGVFANAVMHGESYGGMRIVDGHLDIFDMMGESPRGYAKVSLPLVSVPAMLHSSRKAAERTAIFG